MKRATFFKSAAPSSPEQAKPNRQSIRGRISAPIPILDPLDPPASAPNEIPAAAPAPASAPVPVPAPVEEAAVPEANSPMPTSPPPPNRASPPPPVVSAFSEDLESSNAEEEAADETHEGDADAEPEVGNEEEVSGDVDHEEKVEEAAEAGDASEDAEPVIEPAEVSVPKPTNDHAENDQQEEAATLEEPLPPLQSPKVRSPAAYTAGHRRIPTAELQSPQLPLPEPPASPPSQSQARLQYQIPQDQPSPFRQPGQPSGSSPPPLSVGPSALSSARASGTASAANSAASPAFRHRTNPSSTLRYSGASGMSSGGTGGGGGTSAGNTVSGSPKRKKSTLRGAFSKLFSRRKKTDSQILPTIAADPGHDVYDMRDSQQALQQQQYQPQYHQQQHQQQQQQQQQAPQHRSVRSDPTVLSRPRDSEPKRSASLPITEYDRALRSHSIGPEELIAIESARNSFQADHGPGGGAQTGLVDASGRRRAATATNRAFFPPQMQGGRRRFNNKSETYANILSGSGWTGLSPRPASAQGRKSQNRLSGSDIVSGAAGGGLGRNWATGSTDAGAGGPASAGLGLGAGFNLFGGAGGAGRNGSGGPGTDPNEIGRAITSNGRDSLEVSNDLSSRRRSRSLSNLHSLSFDQNQSQSQSQSQFQSRGRNDEIRYWRESYDLAFLSPLSSSHDMGHEHDDDEEEGGLNVQGSSANAGPSAQGIRSVDGAAFHGGEDDLTGTISLLQSLPDSPIDSPIEQDDERQKGKQPPKTPPQPFSFVNLSSLGGVSGPMKITQANNSMDNRIGGLETRMHRMERVVDQLCHTMPGYKEPTATATAAGPDQIPRSVPPFPDAFSGQPAIPPIPAIYQAQAAGTPFAASSSRYSNSRHSAHSGDSFESDLQHSHMSFGEGQTYIGSLHPPSSSSATQAQSIMASAGGPSNSPALRPASTSTVRGATSLPALNAAIDNSTAELLAQLKSEREVRQTLETQVKKLNERVNALSTTMYAMLRDPAAARPKSSHHKPSLALGTTPSTNSLRGKSASAAASAAAAVTQLKAESVLQTAKALGHGVSSFSADEETESEGFQTPMEGHYNYGGGDENDATTTATNKVDDTKRKKKAARTLSLGQLTLGKSAVQT